MDAIAGYGLLALFAVLLAKESGVPIPVPSDLLNASALVDRRTLW